jgi:hypothetical protein
MKIYINGELDNTNTTSIPSSLMDNNYATYIGQDDDNTSRHFNGLMGTTKIYSKALSSKQIRKNYNHQKRRYI